MNDQRKSMKYRIPVVLIPKKYPRKKVKSGFVYLSETNHNEGRDTYDLVRSLLREAAKGKSFLTEQWITMSASQILDIYEKGYKEFEKQPPDPNVLGYVYEMELGEHSLILGSEEALKFVKVNG